MVVALQESASKVPAANAEAQAEFKVSHEAYVRLLEKHGVMKEGDDLFQGLRGGFDWKEDADALEQYAALLEGVDLGAFLRDALAWMTEHGGGKQNTSALRTTEGFVLDAPAIEVTGEVAVARARGGDGPPLRMVRYQGRWFIDLQTMMEEK